MVNEMLVESKEPGLDAPVFPEAGEVPPKNAAPLVRDIYWNDFQKKMSSQIFKHTILKLVKKVYSGALSHDEVVAVLTIAAKGNNGDTSWAQIALDLSRLLEKFVKRYVWGNEFSETIKWLLSLLAKASAGQFSQNRE